MKFDLKDLLNLVTNNMFATRRETANEIVRNHVLWAMGAGLTPIPLVDVAAVTAVQLNMIRNLCEKYQVEYSESLGKSLITALIGSGAARVGASLVKGVPIVGFLLGALPMSILSGASTFAVGQVFVGHFEAHGTMDNFDVETWRRAFEDQFELGKDFAAKLRRDAGWNSAEDNRTTSQQGTSANYENKNRTTTPDDMNNMDEMINKLEKLNDLKAKGILTEEEFLAKKQSLLQQL